MYSLSEMNSYSDLLLSVTLINIWYLLDNDIFVQKIFNYAKVIIQNVIKNCIIC